MVDDSVMDQTQSSKSFFLPTLCFSPFYLHAAEPEWSWVILHSIPFRKQQIIIIKRPDRLLVRLLMTFFLDKEWRKVCGHKFHSFSCLFRRRRLQFDSLVLSIACPLHRATTFCICCNGSRGVIKGARVPPIFGATISCAPLIFSANFG